MDGGVAPLPGGLCFASDLKLDSHLCDEDACLCMYVCMYVYPLLVRQVIRGGGGG